PHGHPRLRRQDQPRHPWPHTGDPPRSAGARFQAGFTVTGGPQRHNPLVSFVPSWFLLSSIPVLAGGGERCAPQPLLRVRRERRRVMIGGEVAGRLVTTL